MEVNATYYSSFKPDSWAKWRAATPDGFKFSVKASRFCTNRKVLADGKQSVEYFLNRAWTVKGEGRYQWVDDRRGVNPDGLALTIGLKRYF